jgi:mannosyltransferase
MSAAAPVPAPAAAPAADAGETAGASRLPCWWPLVALTLLAAILRLSTLDLQSFWYDEAFTPVHVLHHGLWATLRSVSHTENSPPLWYLIEWVDSRVLGTGEVALRLPSALAGIATVPVAWAIGRELLGPSIEDPPARGSRRRRTAIVCAALVTVNPLFVWYSQEARVYGLFVLTAAVAMLCFLRAERDPTARRMATFALAGAVALLTHYFAVFLLAPMVLWLLLVRPGWGQPGSRAALAACGAIGLVGVALLPLISAQGGHGTQWIGRWPLSERLQAIPRYFLTGYSGEPLGRGIELLVALPIVAGLVLWLSRVSAAPTAVSSQTTEAVAGAGAEDSTARERRGALIALLLAACGVVIPIALAILGADYLAPRNLVAAMIPATALIAVALASPALGRIGTALALILALAFVAISVDVSLSPRLQRGNWREVAHALRADGRPRAITTVELGAAPLEYYLPGLHNLQTGRTVLVSEIDETGYAPLRASAGEPPAPGFQLIARLNVDGLIVYRFVSGAPRAVSQAALRRHVITLAHPEVLVPAAVG